MEQLKVHTVKVKLTVSVTRFSFCSDGADYYNATGELIFSAGSTAGDSECVDVGIINDEVFELREFFYFALYTEGSTAVILRNDIALVNIDDEDGRFQYNIRCLLCT